MQREARKPRRKLGKIAAVGIAAALATGGLAGYGVAKWKEERQLTKAAAVEIAREGVPEVFVAAHRRYGLEAGETKVLHQLAVRAFGTAKPNEEHVRRLIEAIAFNPDRELFPAPSSKKEARSYIDRNVSEFRDVRGAVSGGEVARVGRLLLIWEGLQAHERGPGIVYKIQRKER